MDVVNLLTVEQAAARAQVSPWTIRKMIQRGKLPAVNYGSGSKGIYRIKPEDLGNVQPVQPPAPRESRKRRRFTPAATARENAWPPPEGWSV